MKKPSLQYHIDKNTINVEIDEDKQIFYIVCGGRSILNYRTIGPKIGWIHPYWEALEVGTDISIILPLHCFNDFSLDASNAGFFIDTVYTNDIMEDLS